LQFRGCRPYQRASVTPAIFAMAISKINLEIGFPTDSETVQ